MYYKENFFKDLPVNNHDNLLTKRLEATYNVITNCTSDHYCTLQNHSVLKLPGNYNIEFTDSELINRFMKKLKRKWNTGKRGKLHYTWCKEVEKGKGAHWHLMTFVDHRLSQKIYINNLIEQCWQYALKPQNYKKGLVHRAGYATFKNNDLQEIEDAMKWASYLCKSRRGSKNAKGNFRTSQVDRTLKLVA